MLTIGQQALLNMMFSSPHVSCAAHAQPPRATAHAQAAPASEERHVEDGLARRRAPLVLQA